MGAEKPICLGDPAVGMGSIAGACDDVAGIVQVQVRPDKDGNPIVMALASCPSHSDAVLAWMVKTWPYDDVYLTSLAEWYEVIEPMHAESGDRTALVAV